MGTTYVAAYDSERDTVSIDTESPNFSASFCSKRLLEKHNLLKILTLFKETILTILHKFQNYY